MNVRLEDSELLKDWGETVRVNRAIPARRAYRRLGRYDPRTLSGCDVIVCWRHNCDDCPKHIEILELSSVIESLSNRED